MLQHQLGLESIIYSFTNKNMKSSMNENYSTKCPDKKTSKKTSRGETSEVLASQFELDFIVIVCMAITMMGTIWYLESSALFHMTGNNDFCSAF